MNFVEKYAEKEDYTKKTENDRIDQDNENTTTMKKKQEIR